jgi:hypothetical protein
MFLEVTIWQESLLGFAEETRQKIETFPKNIPQVLNFSLQKSRISHWLKAKYGCFFFPQFADLVHLL